MSESGLIQAGLESVTEASASLERVFGPLDELVPEGRPECPLILVVGPPRSGTTLVLQCLAASGGVAVPSNLLARFYKALYAGSLIQRLFCDPLWDLKDEMVAGRGAIASRFGKTEGALQPSEFMHFWRRFLPLDCPRRLTVDELEKVDAAGLERGLRALECGLGKPVATKGFLLQFSLDVLRPYLPELLLIRMRRNVVEVADSILSARLASGSLDAWWSLRPPGCDALQGLPPVQQVLGQIRMTESALDQMLATQKFACLDLSFRELVSRPSQTFQQLKSFLESHGVSVGQMPEGVEQGINIAPFVPNPLWAVELLEQAGA